MLFSRYCVLLLPAILGHCSAAVEVEDRERLLSILQRIPRVPLRVQDNLARSQGRSLQMDLKAWSKGDGDIQCDFVDDSLDADTADLNPEETADDDQEQVGNADMQDGDSNKETMKCTMTVGGTTYQMQEICTGADDTGSKMQCNNCIKDPSKADFSFCYAIECDFSALFDEDTKEPQEFADTQVVEQLEQNMCKCTGANINGDTCDSCDVCPMTQEESNEVGVQMFTNLALSCKSNDLVTPACTLDRNGGKDHSGVSSDAQKNSTSSDKSGMGGWGKFFIVLLVFGFVGFAVNYFFFKANSSSAASPSTVDTSFATTKDGTNDLQLNEEGLEDAVIT